MLPVQQRAVAALRSTDWIDDDVLYHLLRDVLARAFTGACVIDPVLIALLIDSPALAGDAQRARKKSDEATLSQCRAEFAAAQRDDALLLLPLHCDGHWSLLAYRPAWRQWYACDSMGDYHRTRALACLEALDRLGLVPQASPEGEAARVLWYDDLPRQPQSYECARYVLFYAFVLLRNHCDSAARDSSGEFQARLERELAHVCEAHRPGFEAHLLRMLEQ